MPSLLLAVFVLQLLIHLINTTGPATVNSLIWLLYNALPTSTSKAVHDQSRLKAEVLKLKKQMSSTSTQDEFAKWAKLRRQHDKVLAEYDKTTESLSSSKASFESTVTVARWLSTNGLRFFLQFWYSKQALFWIPQNWLPNYVEWMLAFPRAPRGSISIQIWGIACASIIQLVGGALVALYVLATAQNAGKKAQHPQRFEARGKPPASRSQADSPARKKEL